MADSYFLTKTVVAPERLLPAGAETAVEQAGALRQFLYGRLGRETAELFAEPVLSRGNGAAPTTISWYVSRAGEGRRLGDLGAEARVEAEALLRRRLAAAAEALSDPDFGPLVGAALTIDAPEDVWTVDGRPVLVNWGVAPPETLASGAARERHFADTLGRYLPLAAPPAITREEWLARGYVTGGAGGVAGAGAAGTGLGVAPGAAAPVGPTASAATASTAAAGASVERARTTASVGGFGAPPPVMGHAALHESEPSRWRWRWIAPVGLLALFAGLLVWFLTPGALLYPPVREASVIENSAVEEAARAANRALEERIAALRGALEGAVCTPQGELVLPSGLTPDGRAPLVPGPDGAPAERAEGPTPRDPGALAPPPPSQIVTPGRAGGDPAPLLATLEASTAIVLAIGDEASGHGTGFFIGPDLLVTNHHVIAPALVGGRLLVTNQRLGRLTEAELLANDGPMEQTGADFALLRVTGADMPAYAVLRPASSLKLQQVIAAGYPGFVLETDDQFQALIQGDAGAIPGLVVTDGIVNAEQRLGPNTNAVVHTAHISPGNSGGPLVDACGRVVGINTFIRNDETSLNSLNFALASADLLAFLEANGATAQTTEEACAPVVAQASPPRTAAPVETPAEGSAERPGETPAEPVE